MIGVFAGPEEREEFSDGGWVEECRLIYLFLRSDGSFEGISVKKTQLYRNLPVSMSNYSMSNYVEILNRREIPIVDVEKALDCATDWGLESYISI